MLLHPLLHQVQRESPSPVVTLGFNHIEGEGLPVVETPLH